MKIFGYGSLAAVLALGAGLLLLLGCQQASADNVQAALQRETIAYAAEMYVSTCAVCHGAAGEGVEGVGKALDCDCNYVDKHDEAFAAIADGVADTIMTPWHYEKGGIYNDVEIEALVTLIQSAEWGVVRRVAAEVGFIQLTLLDDSDVSATVNPATLQRVLPLYEQVCAVCHGLRGEGVVDSGSALNTDEIRQTNTKELVDIIDDGVIDTTMVGYGELLNDSSALALAQLMQNWDALEQ